MKVLKKAAAIVLSLALAMPVIVGTEADAAKKKVPEMLFVYTEALPETSSQIFIESNKTKILKTTWSTSKKSVAKLSKKKKTSVTFKTGKVGNEAATVTAKVKYKVGKKVKTKKLTCKVKVVWLQIDSANGYTGPYGKTSIALHLNALTTNINKYDDTPDEGETFIEGAWTTNAANVAEVTDITSAATSGTAVSIEKVEAGGTEGWVSINLEKALKENVKYHVVLKGFKGSGSKMMIETDVEINPIKVTVSPVGYINPNSAGDMSLILTADKPFTVGREIFVKENNDLFKYITVKDESGKELPVEGITGVTYKTEGDGIIINIKGGVDSKKFTVTMTSEFPATYLEAVNNVYYLAEETIVVDKPAEV